MIHLIYVSIPVDKIPEYDSERFEATVNRWAENPIYGFNAATPANSFQVRRVKDFGGQECIEWRRTWDRVLHIPNIREDGGLGLINGVFADWWKYVQQVSVATDEPFRPRGMARYADDCGETNSFVGERRDEDGLIRLMLAIRNWPSANFERDLAMLQGLTAAFLQEAAIHHLAKQAYSLLTSDNPDDKIGARKKLMRIIRITNLEANFGSPGNEQEQE